VAANDARYSGTAGYGRSAASGGEGYRTAPLCSSIICDPESPPYTTRMQPRQHWRAELPRNRLVCVGV